MRRISITKAATFAGLLLLGSAAQTQAAIRISAPALDSKGDFSVVPTGGGYPTSST